MSENTDAFNLLLIYSLTHSDPAFIHQYVVDAQTAQTAEEQSIGLVFALAGLYLHLEKELTGKQIQQFHLKMAHDKKMWPLIDLPKDRGSITAADVMKMSAGPARDQKIDEWCTAVWKAFSENHNAIRTLLAGYLN